jgi:mono/diheme cytochrome c family protein
LAHGVLAFVALIVLWRAAQYPTLAAEPTKSQLDFFENKVRPIFAGNCYQCHSPAKGKVKGELELDWKGGWERGGENGPVIVPGDPEKSRLIRAVGYTDPDLQMPPKGDKLTEAQINDLVAWVKMGAPDPRTVRPAAAAAAGAYARDGKDHWAFKPVKKPALPAVQNESWIKNDVDRFILAKLEGNGMKPNEPADKRTLIRRVCFDLIGLPPTPEEVDDFLNDESPKAFEKLVDKLLASPRYGERWGRHWLDVARYSDSKGQFDRRRESSIYPYAWTYRDYVIRAFNADKPYDRFILEQLAADRLNLGNNSSDLAALGFLTVGDHFNGNPNDVINDRIDVTSKAFLGVTVSCARCHDHKFDPIPQADYYSLHGIFASSLEPAVKPAIAGVNADTNYQAYLLKRAEMDARIQNVETQIITSAFGDSRRLAGVYLCASEMAAKDRDAYLTKFGADPDLLKNWQRLLKGGGRQAASIFGPWNFLSRIPRARFAVQAPRFLAHLDDNERARQLNPHVVQALKGARPQTMAEVAAIYGTLFSKSEPAWQATLAGALSDAALRFAPNRQRAQLFALREQSDMLEMVHPGAPARAMVLQDSPTPKDSPIFIRGEAENRGDSVPRRFLEVLSGPNSPAFKNGSGRLELAQAIANKNNPLTARVMVNRVWLHHFGEGIVTTPEDFGNQSAPPSHPELLDYLAARFTEEGWSLKKLHKLIVLSATYQQGSHNNPAYAEKDPFNRLLWRANVRRLEFEPLRDSILYFGGKLDLSLGGHPIDLSEGTHITQKRFLAIMNRFGKYDLPTAPRRSVYGYIDRADLVEVLNTFDFASPDMPMGKRYETAVPQQALFLMNSPLVIEQVRNAVNRPEFRQQNTDEDRIRYLYELFFQRLPLEQEIQDGKEFLAAYQQPEKADSSPAELQPAVNAAGPANPRKRPVGKPISSRATRRPLSGWQEYAHALLLSNETSFVN